VVRGRRRGADSQIVTRLLRGHSRVPLVRRTVGSFHRASSRATLGVMKNAIDMPTLVPLLVVRDAARAIEFYAQALGAKETSRFVNKRNDFARRPRRGRD
jgi:hypothetical protein